ncbi:hypothetical protein AAZX31_08G343600 [Glycine max]|uniref:Uncharacterized protein n=3 Tax=Glycine subgen. Soja TaxID=1462606 RepID=I1KZ90_SOYBN|nr:uncharacterized protein LOC100306013 isoform 1 [Glycine max]XP_028246418.1 uncharacterized protein LOC114423748 [Glycine soja]KAG5002324.1 hypothetical protein JHK87_023396 [Glycine soja]KAG5017846.1 hypothetical protein JHK85_023982 [Glycine max]KAG5027597.1 hypothetical protein JHK86_023511 [Glycine max]KAG5138719.1 hypothetical protein JHK82_023450 [Glycine max]KAH1054634.1 hypothetical protein GYH30_023426 [Glycine max]|eukprot:NP_001236281.2 uncharacterized protein LOC100306013 isoform 1 [Glycine max]
MESTSSKVNVPNSRQLSKQLLFDRRYGWVIDEWKDPAEEALDGGRGMFCILPLAKALVHKASQSINCAVISVKKASEKPELFSHQMLQSALDDGVKSFMTSLKNVGSKGFILNKNSQSQAFNNPSHSLTGSNE